MTCLQRYSRGWGTLSNSRGFFGNTFSEMKKCWVSLPFLWKAMVDTYRNFFTTGTILLLLSAAGGWLNSKVYALSDKITRNSRKAKVACERWWHVWKSGSTRGFWAGPVFWEMSSSSICEQTPLWFTSRGLFDLWVVPLRFLHFIEARILL